MSDGTKIEWADATVNAVNGCSIVSPGCTNCYAMRLAGTRMKHHPTRAGLTQDSKAGPVWTGVVRLHEPALLQPLHWKRPRHIFWNAHGDLFHDAVPDEWIDRVFAVCAFTPQHTHMILTKRSARMREYFNGLKDRGDPFAAPADEIADAIGLREHPAVPEPGDFPLPNVWLGVSVEDQARADERIPDLLATPAAVRFISAEPLLGPVDLEGVRGSETCLNPECWGDCACDDFAGYDPGCRRNGGDGTLTRKIDWVIAGGESGPGARPMHPDWARSLRDQCAAAGVAFHFKQWGEWGTYFGEPAGNPGKFAAHHSETGRWSFYNESPRQFWIFGADSVRKRVGKKAAGRLLDGVTHDGLPGATHA